MDYCRPGPGAVILVLNKFDAREPDANGFMTFRFGSLMKKLALSSIFVAAMAAASVASAGLTFTSTGTGKRTEMYNVAGQTFASGTEVSLGYLSVSGPGTVTYSYVGEESGYKNVFYNLYVSGSTLVEGAKGASISQDVTAAGALNFKFTDSAGGYAVNGGARSDNASIGLISSADNSFLIGYNDIGGGGSTLGDWDDFVVRVSFVAAPVPEPESYAMMLAGLGVMGLIARRRKNKASA